MSFFGRFVSCLAFVWDSDNPDGLLVSGSGDSTVSDHKIVRMNCFLPLFFLSLCWGIGFLDGFVNGKEQAWGSLSFSFPRK